ncbi:hypothetical protein L1987_23612 [Smallanthus sonchifolius]|uniref:Uncharacterized protein n=1 Tax=Smallanthus sonchifolius TaxID=185202 RepID=A0ACB9IID0_9ASTR|nr:hypothetical protein L1987_23612 [Smallanthus sonchifolius]
MCVLARGAFLPFVPGIGIGKAHALVSMYRYLDRVLSVLKFEKGGQLPKDYLVSFKESLVIFHHARICDADLKWFKHLTPLGETLLHYSSEKRHFLGPELSSSPSTAIVEGKGTLGNNGESTPLEFSLGGSAKLTEFTSFTFDFMALKIFKVATITQQEEATIDASANGEMILLQTDALTFVYAIICFPHIASLLLYRLDSINAKRVLASKQLSDVTRHVFVFLPNDVLVVYLGPIDDGMLSFTFCRGLPMKRAIWVTGHGIFLVILGDTLQYFCTPCSVLHLRGK